jgi:hypothetical protein
MSTPFFHEEIEVKKKFLELAREFKNSDELEKELASAMLYANMSEYLAYNLIESLKQSIYSGSKAFWNGSIYVNLSGNKDNRMTIGQIAVELRKFGFPSKEIIIPLLDRIAQNRNTIMHKMLRTPAGRLEEIDQSIRELAEDTEELVIAIDDIYRGLPPTNITQVFGGSSSNEVEAVENESGEITVREKSNGDGASARTARKKST